MTFSCVTHEGKRYIIPAEPWFLVG